MTAGADLAAADRARSPGGAWTTTCSVRPSVSPDTSLAQRAAQASRQRHRGRAGQHRGQGDDGAGRPGERRGQPDRHRPGQPQPAQQPVRQVTPAGRRGAARRDGRRRAEPGGPHRRQQRGQPGQDDQRAGHGGVHPAGHAERGRPRTRWRSGRAAARPAGSRSTTPARQPGRGRDHGLAGVGRRDLPGGEADALQDADPPVPSQHRPADHVDHDQHGQHQAGDAERDQERRDRRDPGLLLGPDGQPGQRAADRMPAAAPRPPRPRRPRTAAAVPALRNRYSICRAAGCSAAGCRAAAVAGVTQPSAEPVTDAATPTTVSVPGRPGTVSCRCRAGSAAGCRPNWTARPGPAPGPSARTG